MNELYPGADPNEFGMRAPTPPMSSMSLAQAATLHPAPQTGDVLLQPAPGVNPDFLYGQGTFANMNTQSVKSLKKALSNN